MHGAILFNNILKIACTKKCSQTRKEPFALHQHLQLNLLLLVLAYVQQTILRPSNILQHVQENCYHSLDKSCVSIYCIIRQQDNCVLFTVINVLK